MTYDVVTEECTWLESKWNGQLARYATSEEESIWVCHACQRLDVDSEEHECSDEMT